MAGRTAIRFFFTFDLNLRLITLLRVEVAKLGSFPVKCSKRGSNVQRKMFVYVFLLFFFRRRVSVADAGVSGDYDSSSRSGNNFI